MCSVGNHSVLTSSQLCGFGVGGFCNLTTSKCECANGFTHDMISLRQRDCAAPIAYLRFIFGFITFMSAFTVLFSIIKVRNSVSTAKKIMLMICGNQLLLFLNAVCFFFTGYRMNWLIAFTYYLGLSMFFAPAYTVFYTLASPLYKIAERSEDGFLLSIKVLFAVFRIIQLCIMVIAVSLFEDFNKESNDFGWNACLVLSIGLYGIEAFIAMTTAVYFGRKLVKFVELLIQMTPDNPNHITTKPYLKKVKNLLAAVWLLSPGIVILNVLIPVLYFSLGYVPFIYIPVTFTWSVIPPLSIAAVVYSSREKVSTGVQIVSPPSQIIPNSAATKDTDVANISAAYGNKKNAEHERDLQSKYLTTLYEESKIQSNNDEHL